MQVFIYGKITLHVSGVHRTRHQDYVKSYVQPLVQVIVYEQQPSSSVANWPRRRKIFAVPEAAVRVLCTPYYGCEGHPTHVE